MSMGRVSGPSSTTIIIPTLHIRLGRRNGRTRERHTYEAFNHVHRHRHSGRGGFRRVRHASRKTTAVFHDEGRSGRPQWRRQLSCTGRKPRHRIAAVGAGRCLADQRRQRHAAAGPGRYRHRAHALQQAQSRRHASVVRQSRQGFRPDRQIDGQGQRRDRRRSEQLGDDRAQRRQAHRHPPSTKRKCPPITRPRTTSCRTST